MATKQTPEAAPTMSFVCKWPPGYDKISSSDELIKRVSREKREWVKTRVRGKTSRRAL